MRSPRTLSFGIPSLDALFPKRTESGDDGIEIPDRLDQATMGPTTSICIIGPDGTGKSILAMHLASQYASDAMAHGSTSPRVLYISTDLSFEKGSSVWRDFGLHRPWHRHPPFNSKHDTPAPHEFSGEIALKLLVPMQPNDAVPGGRRASVVDYISPRVSNSPVVGFVDLARYTAGDDWSYVNRLLAMLDPPRADSARHLLIIDAVEGLETLVGDLDSFGERRSRRSRIAQVMRAAAGKCHVLFIVEEQRMMDRHPEEFVTDVVLKLRAAATSSGAHVYLRRTIEAVKARAQQVVRGEHPFLMHNGKGSFRTKLKRGADMTLLKASWKYKHLANPDEPPAFLLKQRKGQSAKPEDFCSYIQVYHSLSFINRQRTQNRVDKPKSRRATKTCQFGISHFDDILGKEQGLRFGTVTALIGENGTLKSRIAQHFVSQGIRDNHVVVVVNLDDSRYEDWADTVGGICKNEVKSSPQSAFLLDALIYRKLEIHDRSVPIFFHVIKQAVERGKTALARKLKLDQKTKLTRDECGAIRFVLTNLTTMREVFPDIQSDPLLLPTLVEYLRDEGVTSLIVATEPGRSNSAQQSEFSRELRTLVENHISTWHISFFGEDKIVASVIAPILSNRPAIIRELRMIKVSSNEPKGYQSEMLIVDPHLEMYTGLGPGETSRLVPMSVELIGQGPGFDKYRGEMNGLFGQLFNHGGAADVVKGLKFLEYESLRSFCYLQGDTRMDQTLVLQVDEFWGHHREGLFNLREYILEDVNPNNPGTLQTNDPFRLFQKSDGDDHQELDITKQPKCQRATLFAIELLHAIGLCSKPTESHYLDRNRCTIAAGSIQDEINRRGETKGKTRLPDEIDRIPYYWDFGFLLCRKTLWKEAQIQTVIDYGGPSATQAEPINPNVIRSALMRGRLEDMQSAAGNRGGHLSEALESLGQIRRYRRPSMKAFRCVTWREFLFACVGVARRQFKNGEAECLPFDLDLTGPETLSSLILEMWASEIEISEHLAKNGRRLISLSGKTRDKLPSLGVLFPTARIMNNDQKQFSLIDLLSVCADELFRVFALLTEVLSTTQLGLVDFSLGLRQASRNAAAVRHWYSTASIAMNEQEEKDPLVCLPLPGGFSVRGDWYLAIAKGSRSPRLGCRALDVLSSRRSNIARLQNGLGLPVRKVLTEGETPFTKLYEFEGNGRRRNITISELQRLGQSDIRRWLWRSNLRDYDRHARLFGKLIGRVFLRWPEIWDEISPHARSGFYAYDKLLLEPNPKDPEFECVQTAFANFNRFIVDGFSNAFGFSSLSRSQ